MLSVPNFHRRYGSRRKARFFQAKTVRSSFRDSGRRRLQLEPLEARWLLTTITVDTLDDNMVIDGQVTLREAIYAANTDTSFDVAPAGSGADEIRFDASLFSGGPGTVTLGGTQLEITDQLIIAGPGSGDLTIDANSQSRVFYIAAGVTAEISGLTLNHGSAVDGGGAILNLGSLIVTNSSVVESTSLAGVGSTGGGGICNRGSLTVSDSILARNSVWEPTMSALGYGGGIFNEGTLTIVDSWLNENEAMSGRSSMGGAIFNVGDLWISDTTFSENSGRLGGAIRNSNTQTMTPTMTIDASTFFGNTARVAGAVHNVGTAIITANTFTGNSAGGAGAISHRSGTLTLIDSTISGNWATDTDGGGLTNSSFRTTSGTMNIINSTITGNWAANNGGAIANDPFGTLNITNSTISENWTQSGIGGGMYSHETGSMVVNNTIVAGNADFSSTAPDISGIVTNGDYNLIQDLAGWSFASGGAHNITGQDPLLGPLGNHGGPTQTVPLWPASPAIGSADNSLAPATDQRGVTRDANPDIGAFESRGFLLATVGGDGQRTPVDSPFAEPLIVSVTSAFDEPVNGGWITFSSPTSGASAMFPAGSTLLIQQGQVSVAVQANSVGGTYTVAASAAGAPLAAEFTLTNNLPPLAVDDFYSVAEDATLAVDAPGVLANDTDPNEDLLNAIRISGPSHGVVTLDEDGSFEYVPHPGYVGPNSFSYRASDGLADSNAAAVTIAVRPTTYFIDDTFRLDVDSGDEGLSKGDIVTFAAGEAGETGGLIYGLEAFSRIQQGIDAAFDGDTVLVAAGNYQGRLVWEEKDIQLLGAGAAVTIVDAAASEIDPDTCLTITDVPGTALLDGFTITGGYHSVSQGHLGRGQGGIAITHSSLTVAHNTITGNTSELNGGGVGIVQGSSPTVVGNAILDNTALNDGGAINVVGSSPTLVNNVIAGNVAGRNGGAVRILSANSGISTVVMTNNTMVANSALSTPADPHPGGGGIYVIASPNRPAFATVTNNIVWGNVWETVDGQVLPDDLRTRGTFPPDSMGIVVSHSDFGVAAGSVDASDNNIQADPQWIDPDNGNYHLQPGSPCIDVGSNTAPALPLYDIDGNSRVVGVAVDMGAYEVQSPQDQIQEISNQVLTLLEAEILNAGQANSFLSKLDGAQASFDQGNVNAGMNKLGAFINQVNAFINSGKLTGEQGQTLIDAAEAVINSALAQTEAATDAAFAGVGQPDADGDALLNPLNDSLLDDLLATDSGKGNAKGKK